jgi:hypothetical protein
MTEGIKNITGVIRDSVAAHDQAKLKEIVDDVATYCFQDDSSGEEFDECIFNVILEMMERPQFLDMDGSYYLLMLFQFDWSMLTAAQRERLSLAIEHSYCNYRDWMACFVLSEILGQNYCNEQAFKILCRLRECANEIPRSLLPMAYEYIARSVSNLELKSKAILELKAMTTDPFERVRNEATESLERLRSRGLVAS